MLGRIKEAINTSSELRLKNLDRKTLIEITPDLISYLKESSITNLTINYRDNLTDVYNSNLVDMHTANPGLQRRLPNHTQPRDFRIYLSETLECRTVSLMIDLLAANLSCMREVCIDNEWLMNESELDDFMWAIKKNTTINTLRIFKENFSLENLKILLSNKNISTLSWGGRLSKEEFASFDEILFTSHINALFILQPDLELVADILLTIPRLQKLVLSAAEGWHDFNKFAKFLRALAYNSTLEFLKITHSGPSRAYFPQFIEAVQRNKGLNNLILFNAPLYDEMYLKLHDMANLHSKLRCRYYYGGGPEHTFIPLVQKGLDYYSMNAQLGLNEIQKIVSLLENEQQSGLSAFTPYINEALRLFEALKYFSGGEPLTRKVTDNFLLPFTFPKFQAVADLALGLLIATNPVFEDWEEMEKHQYIFNKLKKSLAGSVFEDVFHISWRYLQTKDDSLAELTNFRNTHVLISYDQIKHILIHLISQSLPTNIEEVKLRSGLLKLLNTNYNYHPSLVSILWRSPVFLNTLYDRYPNRVVYIVEDYLLLNINADMDMSEVLERVNSSQVVLGRQELSEDALSLLIQEVIQKLGNDAGISEDTIMAPSCAGLMGILQSIPQESWPAAVLAPEEAQPPEANSYSFFYNPVKKAQEIYNSTRCTIL